MNRIGLGYDLHRLVEGRPLILSGIEIPSPLGLMGHSDADAVLHAVTDGLLGALSMGDIGELFPDDDPQFAGADSKVLLREVVRRVHAKSYRVVNCDVNVLAERPKLKAHKHAMRASLAELLQVEDDAVGMKAKTREGCDAVGHGEAIEVHAIVLLERDS